MRQTHKLCKKLSVFLCKKKKKKEAYLCTHKQNKLSSFNRPTKSIIIISHNLPSFQLIIRCGNDYIPFFFFQEKSKKKEKEGMVLECRLHVLQESVGGKEHILWRR